MLVVLFAGLLHALWNALVRSAADKFQSTLMVVCGAGALSLLLLPFLPMPAVPSWPYLLASGLIHVAYFMLVALSYRHAELSFAYPVMRGLAPALAALAALVFLRESPPALGWVGIALICAGVLLLSGAAWRAVAVRHAALSFALLNACVIALYTLVDGQGVRLSAHALSYTAWVFVLTAPLLLGTAWLLRSPLRPPDKSAWRTALLGGGSTLVAYSLVLWAMTHAPIALVAALRETSIVFAALIGVLFLKEPIGRLRLASVCLVCAGAATLKLA
jgi:drug/metabolite transporter (DMT)-like permease